MTPQCGSVASPCPAGGWTRDSQDARGAGSPTPLGCGHSRAAAASLPACPGYCSAVSCATAPPCAHSAEALRASGHQGAALDSSVILKSRGLILKPFSISRHTQAEGEMWHFQSDQLSVASPAAGHLHRGGVTPFPSAEVLLWGIP